MLYSANILAKFNLHAWWQHKQLYFYNIFGISCVGMDLKKGPGDLYRSIVND